MFNFQIIRVQSKVSHVNTKGTVLPKIILFHSIIISCVHIIQMVFKFFQSNTVSDYYKEAVP